MAEKLSKHDTALQDALDKRKQPKTTTTTDVTDADKETRKLKESMQSVAVPAMTREQRQLHRQALLATEQDKLQEDTTQEEEAQRVPDIVGAAKNVQQDVQDKLTPVANKIGSLRTVGGLSLVFAILAFLLIAIVRVNNNGDTRLKQWWYMLNGRATLQGHVVPTASQGAKGASTDFSTNTSGGSANFSTSGGASGFTPYSPYRSNGAF